VPGRLRPSTLKDRFVGNKGVNAIAVKLRKMAAVFGDWDRYKKDSN